MQTLNHQIINFSLAGGGGPACLIQYWNNTCETKLLKMTTKLFQDANFGVI